MNIETVRFGENGNLSVNEGLMSVPDDMNNRHRKKIEIWVKAGNVISPFFESIATPEDFIGFAKEETIKGIETLLNKPASEMTTADLITVNKDILSLIK